MKDSDIKNSIDSIESTAEAKERIYWAIQREAAKKGAISSRRLHYFKLKLDKAIPYIAACIILLCAFSFYAVSTGLFTDVVQMPPDKAVSSLAYENDEQKGDAKSFTVTSDINSDGNTDKTPAGLSEGNSEIRDLVKIYAALDVGFTVYNISNVPADAFKFWDEMLRIKAVPAGISLVGYDISDNSLTLNFNEELQNYLNKTATTYMLIGMAQSFKSMYPDIVSIAITSDSQKITFSGEEVDTDSLLAENISITDTKELSYGK